MPYCVESLITLVVEVEIDVAYILYIVLGPAVRAILNRVHSHVYVGTGSTLIRQPRLKAMARYGFRLGDGLNRVARGAIPNEDRNVVRRAKKLTHIFRGIERSRCECAVGDHG